MLKKRTFQLVFTAGSLILLAACGGGTKDPAQKYANLTDQAVAPHDTKPRNQGYGVDGLILNTESGEELIFTEGESNSYIIQGRTPISGVTFELVPQSTPDGIEFKSVPDQPNAIEIVGNPEIGYLPMGLDYKRMTIEFTMKPTSVTNDEAKMALDVVDKRDSVDLIVRRTQRQPVIEKIEGLSERVNEDQVVPFSVIVSSPGTSADKKPLLFKLDNPENLSGEADQTYGGSAFISYDREAKNPESMGDGRWAFHMLFDAPKAMRLAQDEKGSLTGDEDIKFNFSILVNSPINNRPSPQKTITVSVRPTAKASKPTIDFYGLDRVESGSRAQYNFTARVANNRGEVSFNHEQIKTEIAKWPGSAELKCDVKKSLSTADSCTITWDIPCGSDVNAVALNLKATNIVQENSASATHSERITVSESKHCQDNAEASKSSANQGDDQ